MRDDNHRMSLGDAAGAFIAKAEPSDRAIYQQEIGKFVRWYGGSQPVSKISIRDVDTYVSEVESQTGTSTDRLEPLKAFFSYAKQQGLTATNLAVHVRVRKNSGKKVTKVAEHSQRVVHLTPEGYAKLKDELDSLINLRPKIAEELRLAAADKDFRENAPYDVARNHQAQVEARIRELESALKAAVIIEAEQVSTTKVGIGSTVLVRDLIHGEQIRFTLVNPREVDPRNGKISISSPTGKALLDRLEGEEIDVAVPQGVMRYRIEGIEK